MERCGPGARSVLRREKLRPVLIIALLVAIALGTVALLTASWLSGEDPRWWGRVAPSPDAGAGEALDRAVTSALHLRRPDGSVWALEITEGQANAWLRDRLPKWVANRGAEWPRAILETGVAFEPGVIRIGARSDLETGRRVMSAAFRPVIDESGNLAARSGRIGVGRLLLPASLAVPNLRSWIPEDLSGSEDLTGWARSLAGGAPLVEEPAIELSDGRLVRLVGVRVEPGRLVLTCTSRKAAR